MRALLVALALSAATDAAAQVVPIPLFSGDSIETFDGAPGDLLVPPDEGDADGDGWPTCDDCDDAAPLTHAGATEACDGIDNDCDGSPGPTEVDVDADGVRDCEGDCDDHDPDRTPGAAEVCDGLDNDCDGGIAADEFDGDGDGFPLCASDCDDQDHDAWPGAPEVAGDGIDQDCDGADPPGDTDTPSDPDPTDEEKGGCSTVPRGPPWTALFPLLALRRRRS